MYFEEGNSPATRSTTHPAATDKRCHKSVWLTNLEVKKPDTANNGCEADKHRKNCPTETGATLELDLLRNIH